MREKGYFTVEASLILPMATLFIVLMIFMSFYSYDRCILEQSAFQAALRGSSNLIHSNEDAYLIANDAAINLINDKLFAVKKINHEVSANAICVTVAYECEINMPFITWISEFISDVNFTIHVEKKVLRNRQVDTVRLLNGY